MSVDHFCSREQRNGRRLWLVRQPRFRRGAHQLLLDVSRLDLLGPRHARSGNVPRRPALPRHLHAIHSVVRPGLVCPTHRHQRLRRLHQDRR